jgi:hypothetical protein
MKPSPLLLDSLEYPAISYQCNRDVSAKHIAAPIAAQVSAGVRFRKTGKHLAWLDIQQPNQTNDLAFSFTVECFASFRYDSDLGREVYGKAAGPSVVSVNVARILYSSVRDMLATVTARSPYGALIIESQVLEPADVHVGFDDDLDEWVESVFGTFKRVGGPDNNALGVSESKQSARETVGETAPAEPTASRKPRAAKR